MFKINAEVKRLRFYVCVFMCVIMSLNPRIFLWVLSAWMFIRLMFSNDRLMRPAVLLGQGSGPGLIAAPEREFDHMCACVSQIQTPLPIPRHAASRLSPPWFLCV